MLILLIRTFISALRSHRALALENLALRHQLEVLQRNTKRPRLTNRDRTLWIVLSRLWADWRKQLFLVQPETVIRWHKRGFQLHWRWKSRPKWPGRKQVSRDIYNLISTVPTATFRVLYVFLVLSNELRRIVHFNATESPTATWIRQQIIEAFPWDTAPRYLVRDRDKKYGDKFIHYLESMDIQQVLISARSPWQNPYVERLIGSIRRECLDHTIIFGENHLRRVLREYFRYYYQSRTHLGLEKDCPEPRPVESADSGRIQAEPMVGGLHHRYYRRAA